MPHIVVKCFPGRTKEQKELCAKKIAEAVEQTLGCKSTSISVAIKDIREEDWKDEVWTKEIVADKDFLFKNPGYTCD